MKKIYNYCLENANKKNSFFIYLLIAFTESFIFPVPPDILMIPMILANRQRAFKLAFYGTVFSVLGGIIGYYIGFFFAKTYASWIIETYALQKSAQQFYDGFEKWGFWIIALKGFTPIPFKLVTITSGIAQFNLFTFIGASIIARSFRFYLLSGLLWYFGPKIKPVIEKNLNILFFLMLLVIIIGFIIVYFV